MSNLGIDHSEQAYDILSKGGFDIHPDPDEGDPMEYDYHYFNLCDEFDLDPDEFAEYVKERQGLTD